MDVRNDLRNIAIIAHVDHGKTTLVDQLLRQSGVFRANEAVVDRVMDSNDLERERGITILSKNTAVRYKDVKINIIDTPGHADFGGEVERILMMVDGVLLLVDAFEGCMPQTRFVLKKALGLGKKPLVVVNKIDRPGARPAEVVDEVIDLFIELGANEDQLDFPVIYASGRDGYATTDPNVPGKDMKPLLDAILKDIPAPKGDLNGPTQVLFSNIDYDDYVGRIGIGRVERGSVHDGESVVLCHRDGTNSNVKVTKLYQFEGLKRVEVQEARLGDIVAVSGVTGLNIGETICSPDCVEPLPFVKIDEPTVSMLFMVNNSPFAGREGKYVTSRNLRDRLFKEVETNVALRVEETDSADTFKVSGRGELHLSILIEEMRRQGYEFQVSSPSVIYKKINGKKCEPIELLMIEVPDNYVGAVMEKLGPRKAELVNMGTRNTGTTHLEFKIPARGLMGYRQEFLTDTNGNGIMNNVFDSYEPYKGDIATRAQGSLIAHETGESTGYGLFYAQDRGRLFIGPGVDVYEGMIVGASPKSDDITVNICKKKHATNTRASGSDDALKLTPPSIMSLEQCLEFIQPDELVEVTPKSIRMRKTVLSKELRMKQAAKKKSYMNFVILDLEWNGAYSKRLKGYINEIIEFGAVKVDPQLNILDTFEVLIQPQVGKKISGKIKNLTSITNEDLKGGLRFMQAVSRFCKWSGESVVLTWGTSDILALIENCRYFCGDGHIPFLHRYVDLQAYCEHFLPCDGGQQVGLSSAAQMLEISEDGFDHHRALGDSLLSLRCFQKLYHPQSLESFIQDAGCDEFYHKMEFKTVPICDLNHPLIHSADLAFNCDLCGRRARRVSKWQLRNKSFLAEFFCRRCNHKFYGRVRFKLKYEGLVVRKRVLPFTEKKEEEKQPPEQKASQP